MAISASSPAAVPVAADDRDQRIRALFGEHYPGLCRLAYLIVGDAALAEEIVMDAFLRTFASWRRIRDLDRADAYLRRAVVNGTVMASFTVEKFSLERLMTLTPDQINARVRLLKEQAHFDLDA